MHVCCRRKAGEYTQADGYEQYEADGGDYQTYGTEYNQDGGDYYGSSYGADGGGEYEQYGLSDAIPEFSSDSYYKGALGATDGPLDLQEDSTAIPEPAAAVSGQQGLAGVGFWVLGCQQRSRV